MCARPRKGRVWRAECGGPLRHALHTGEHTSATRSANRNAPACRSRRGSYVGGMERAVSCAQRPAQTCRYHPAVGVLAAVVCGMVVDRWYPLHPVAWWSAGVAAWAAWLAAWRLRRLVVAAGALFFCLAALAAAWHHAQWHLVPAGELALAAIEEGSPVCLRGEVRRNPRFLPAEPATPWHGYPRPDRTQVLVQAVAVRDGTCWRAASGKVPVMVDGHLTGVEVGDQLMVFGRLARPRAPAYAGERDVRQTPRSRGELCQVSCEFPDCVRVLERAPAWSLAKTLERVRLHSRRLLRERLGAEEGSLAAALLLGMREDVESQLTESFLETGTIHVMCISGLHVGILAGFLMWGARLGLVARRWGLAAVALAILAYAWLIGAEAPAIRAVVLVLVVCGSLWLGRPIRAFNALACAALVVLAANPAALFRVGPQLSFLSVAALVWAGQRVLPRPTYDPLASLIERTRPWPQRALRWTGRLVWQTTALTACVWIVTAPLVMHEFHLFSPVALLLSPLLALPVAAAIMGGFSALACAWVVPGLDLPFAFVCRHALQLVTKLVAAASTWPGGHWYVPGPDRWWLVGWYLLLAVAVAMPRHRLPGRWIAGGLAAWCALGLGVSLARPGGQELRCTVLPVGHGTCVVLELPGGETLVYDVGQMGAPQSACRTLAGYLWSRGRRHIDAVLLSHADLDHLNGLPEIIDRFSIGVVYVTPQMLEAEQGAAAALLELVRARGIALRALAAGEGLQTPAGCRLHVLHPARRIFYRTDNAASMVLLVEYQGRRVLLPGDIEPPGLEDLLAEEPIDCDAALAPHHGSRHSHPPAFAAWCTPEWVVVSGGRQYDPKQMLHLHSRPGCEVLHTALHGMVQVCIRNGQVEVTSFRQPALAP